MPRAAWYRIHSRLLSTWPGPRTICLDQLFPTRKSPPSSLPCCSTAHRITLHLELTHSGHSSARFGGRISVSASLFPPACSLLAGDRSAGCRRRWRGRGSLSRTAPARAAPSPGYQPLPSPSPWVPMPRSGEAALCLQQWLAGWGKFAPCSFVRVVGRGEALHLIILRIFLCCGCHYCSAQTLPASCLWGVTQWRGLNQGWDASVSPWLWEGWQKTVCPACPAWSINSPPSHKRGQAPPLPNTGSFLQHGMRAPHSHS